MNENKTSCAPADNQQTLWDRIGSFSEFKDQVKELSGSTQVDADSAISELVFYKKLYIEIEYATPPNIKANFYKEVSIKRR